MARRELGLDAYRPLPGEVERYVEEIPLYKHSQHLQYVPSAEEVAAVVCWLLSDAASYINGAVIPVDGAASAVDVGTIAFDPRVRLAPEPRAE